MLRTRGLCIAAIFLAATPLLAQSTAPSQNLPPDSAPAPQPASAPQPGKAIFTLPRTNSALVTLPAHDKPVSSPPETQDQCFAPAEGLYAPHPAWTPEVNQAVKRYEAEADRHLYINWIHGIPGARNSAWMKDAETVVRFAIYPDGSIDTPQVTVRSNRDNFDKHALDAVHQSAPFPPPPVGVLPAFIMCVHFKADKAEHYEKPIDLWPTKPPTPAATPTSPASNESDQGAPTGEPPGFSTQ
jgi:TonB family protein